MSREQFTHHGISEIINSLEIVSEYIAECETDDENFYHKTLNEAIEALICFNIIIKKEEKKSWHHPPKTDREHAIAVIKKARRVFKKWNDENEALIREMMAHLRIKEEEIK